MKLFIRLLVLSSILLSISTLSAQIINVKKKVKNQTINRADQRTDQGINKGLDAIEGGVKGLFKKKDKSKPAENQENKASGQNADPKTTTAAPGSPAMQSFSKFDFVPGEKIIFFDDFTAENIGDFPFLWNTTGAGEVVTTNLYEGRWFNITNGYGIVALAEPLTLPDNYTIEFDVVPQKNPKNADHTFFSFNLMSTSKPKDLNYGVAAPGDAAIRFEFENKIYYMAYYNDKSPTIRGNEDIELLAGIKYKVSMWVQKERIRLYVDQKKVFDLPRVISKNYKYNMIRFDRGVAMIGNVRVATGLPDMRNKLMTDGKLVSYGIYFDVNKDVVKPESYGTLKEIATILNEVPDVKVKIVGHTDSDGEDAKNMDLSKRRSASVKAELAKSFNVNADRLVTDGMGESQPVAPNDSPVNKALNRRVEFIKL